MTDKDKTPPAPTKKDSLTGGAGVPARERESLIPDLPRDESEDAFRKFLEEADFDDEDSEDIKQRIAALSGEGDIIDDE